MFRPGRQEQIASIRAAERAEIQSARNIASAKASLDRQRSRALYQQFQDEARNSRAIKDRQVAFVQSTIGNGAKHVAGAMRAVGTAGIAIAGMGGGALAAASIGQALKLDEMSRRLAISARGPGEQGADPQQLQKAFTQTGIDTGIAPEALAGGAQTYVAKTGDFGRSDGQPA
jgi:hypothetical protein